MRLVPLIAILMALCLDRDGGYDCECSTGFSGNGTYYCEGTVRPRDKVYRVRFRGVNAFASRYAAFLSRFDLVSVAFQSRVERSFSFV